MTMSARLSTRRRTKPLSASQIATFGTRQDGGVTPGCQRKWAFRYISKVPEDAGRFAVAGKKLHEYLEKWLKHGTVPEGKEQEAVTARAMMPFLPLPIQSRVEEPFTLEVDGVSYRGVKDLIYYDNGRLVVHDHKSTSSLDWAKTEEELRHDVQSIIYARDAFEEADVVDLEWLYGTREEKPRVLPVRLNITFDEVASAMEPITRTGKRILKLYAEEPDPNSLPPSLDMCHAFGECEYSRICERSLAQRFKAIYLHYLLKEKKKMGWRDRKQETATPAPAEEKTVNQPSMKERLGFGSSITPPPYEKSVVPNEGVSPESTVAAEEPAKPRRGRKPGSKNKPKETPGEALIQAALDELVEPVGGSGFTLLINTLPASGQPYTTLSEYIRPVLETVAKANQVDYYGQIDYKSGSMLAAALYTHLELNPPSGYLVVDVNTKEGADSLSTLERFAKESFRRF